MHMADALLSPAVSATMLAASGGVVAYSVHEMKKHFDERRIPLMGVAGAFIFAAQMINFSIPGTGSSGHVAGAVLLAALLGPAPAFLVMANVLLVQALFFADGGLLAWGCNLFNMGFFGCFPGYLYVFRPIAGDCRSRTRVFAAGVAACVASLELGALAVTLETLLSGITELPFAAFAAAMLPIHLAIGLGEGLATGAALLFIRRNLPDAAARKLEPARFSVVDLTWVMGLAALALGGGFSLLASQQPDGLEWAQTRVAGAEPAAADAVHALFARAADFFAVLPDYAFPSGADGRLGTIVSGIAGAIGCACILIAAGLLIRRCRRRRAR